MTDRDSGRRLPGLACASVLASISGVSYAQTLNSESVCSQDNQPGFHACAVSAGTSAATHVTAGGNPDFSGYWRRRTWAFENFEEHSANADDFGGTSVVVDPPSGVVPIQPWAEAKRLEIREQFVHHNAACFLSGPAGTMYMTSRFQFLQDDETLAMVGEQLTAHPYRVIPLDGREHIGNLSLWNGDPLGHWEGDSLVIESAHQNGIYMLDQQGRFITDEAQIVERMTLIDNNTIHYEATFDDPNVYTQPFTISFAFRRDTDANPEIWEEACYETNTDSMQLFRNNGLRIFPGISGVEARQLKAAWESKQ
jgi:hypothetical protein